MFSLSLSLRNWLPSHPTTPLKHVSPTYLSCGCLSVSSLTTFLYLFASLVPLYSSSHHHFTTADHISSLIVGIEIEIWLCIFCDWAFVLCVFIWVWWLWVWWWWWLILTVGFVGLVVAVDCGCDDGLLWLVVRYLVAIGFCGGCLFIYLLF